MWKQLGSFSTKQLPGPIGQGQSFPRALGVASPPVESNDSNWTTLWHWRHGILSFTMELSSNSVTSIKIQESILATVEDRRTNCRIASAMTKIVWQTMRLCPPDQLGQS